MTWITITDDLGCNVALARRPERIVSLVPSITETVVALGAGDRLVGITNYCIHPEAALADIPRVGGTKGFRFDRVDALQPDLILANKEENRKRHIDRLRKRCPVFVTHPRTVDGAIKMIRDIGALTGTPEDAARMVADYERALAAVDAAAVPARLRTACLIWRDPWMAAGPDTYMSDLLERFGFENVFTVEEGRYPETTLEAVVERGTDLVILPSEPYEFGEADKREVEAFLRARGQDARVALMDGSYLTWFGARTVAAVGYLADAGAALRRAG